MKDLPDRFKAAERGAYHWLLDAGIRGWTVDLLTKTVKSIDGDFGGLVEFAAWCGWNCEVDGAATEPPTIAAGLMGGGR